MEADHIHNFVLKEHSILGPECCFGPAPCTHCGGCITGSGNHNFDPGEPDGRWAATYECTICGETKTVIE